MRAKRKLSKLLPGQPMARQLALSAYGYPCAVHPNAFALALKWRGVSEWARHATGKDLRLFRRTGLGTMQTYARTAFLDLADEVQHAVNTKNAGFFRAFADALEAVAKYECVDPLRHWLVFLFRNDNGQTLTASVKDIQRALKRLSKVTFGERQIRRAGAQLGIRFVAAKRGPR